MNKNDSVINPFFDLPNENPLTCHVFCLPSAPSNAHFSLSHWSQKIRNLCWKLKSTGHKVIYYGYESCDVACDEKVVVMSEDILMDAFPKCRDNFGHVDINVDPKNPEEIEYLEQKFTLDMEYQVKKRTKPNNFFFYMLPIASGQQMLYTKLKHIPVRHIEAGVGYTGAYLPYRVFESTYIRDFHAGCYHSNSKWADTVMEEAPKKSSEGSSYLNTYHASDFPPPHDTVIPNSFDTSLFDFRLEKDDYFLCLARVLDGKGIREAVEICNRLDAKLVIAGPGDFEKALGMKPGKNIEVIGIVGPDKRRDLLSYARGVFCLSRVHEAFGSTAVEAMLSGTVPITSNSGGFLDTVISGYNGFRVPFNNVEAGINAVENIDKIDPYTLRASGLRFSREQVALQFNGYLQNLDAVLRKNSSEPLIEPDWNREIEWTDGWMTPIDASAE